MIEGENIWNHPSHPGHSLQMVNIESAFKCNGCLELGFGSCYTCTDSRTACDFHLHIDCARAWNEANLAHRFYPKHHFHFLIRGRPNSSCVACGRVINGYAYYCGKKGYDLHPCCAKLPFELSSRFIVSGDGQAVRLVLKKKMTSKCYKCGRNKLWGVKKPWSYVSENQKVHYHVSCVKEMLCEIWQSGLQLRFQIQHYNVNSRGSGNKIGKKVLKMIGNFATLALGLAGDPTGMTVAVVGTALNY